MSKTVDTVVTWGLCSGCGVCAGLCPTGVLKMTTLQNGDLAATVSGQCRKKCQVCLNVCPFASSYHDPRSENVELFGNNPKKGFIFNENIGWHLRSVVGYSLVDKPMLSMISNVGANISKKLATVNIISTWILGVIVAIPLLCFPEVVQLAFGSDYDTRNFKVTFSLVILCSSIIIFKSGLARVMVVNNLLWLGFFSNTLWAIILVVSASFLVQ